MMSSTRWRCSTSSVIAGPWRSSCQKKLLCILQRAAGQDVVERRHAAEQRDVLERARDAAGGRLVRPHLARVAPLKVMRPCCGV